MSEKMAKILAELQRKIETSELTGEPEQPAVRCEICHGIRHIKAEPSGRIIPCPECNAEELQALRQRVHNARLKQSNLPQRYLDANLNEWGNPLHENRKGKVKALFAVHSMVNHPQHLVSSHAIANSIGRLLEQANREIPQWLHNMLDAREDIRAGVALHGDYGVGKTYLAAAAMNAMSHKGTFVLYMRMSHLIQSLRDTWKSDEKTSDLIEKYATVPVLFIDDMSDNSRDDQPLSPHQQDFAATIMRQRMGDNRPTIVTTNWAPNQFALKWGQVCADVMFEGLHWLEVGGVKLRNTTTTQWGDL